MIKREVSIVTGWGDHLGTGHIQRMANLAHHINRHTSLRAFLVCEEIPGSLPKTFIDIITNSIRPGSIFIIRDKRDSTIREMEELKSHCRVIAIDDCGPGRELADLSIDLLPNLKFSISENKLFIYGFTFTDSIMRLGYSSVQKNIDYAIYCGNSPSREVIDRILSLIPKNNSCVILTGDGYSLLKDGASEPLHKSYAETLLSARVLITHFGITLYEGHIAGCRLITVNPTDYHSRLSDKVRDDLDLINLGVIDAIDPAQARSALSESSLNTVPGSMLPSDIHIVIQKGLEMFLSRLQTFL